jgi:hypothetical protein
MGVDGDILERAVAPLNVVGGMPGRGAAREDEPEAPIRAPRQWNGSCIVAVSNYTFM